MGFFIIVSAEGLKYLAQLRQEAGKIGCRPFETLEIILGKNAVNEITRELPSMKRCGTIAQAAEEVVTVVHIYSGHWRNIIEKIDSFREEQIARNESIHKYIFYPDERDAPRSENVFNQILSCV